MSTSTYCCAINSKFDGAGSSWKIRVSVRKKCLYTKYVAKKAHADVDSSFVHSGSHQYVADLGKYYINSKLFAESRPHESRV